LAVVLDAEPAVETVIEPAIEPAIEPEDETAKPEPVDTADAPPEFESTDDEEDAPKPRKSAQELEMEEALRALRALVEADDPDEEPEPARALAKDADDELDEDPKGLTPTDIYAPGERTPWDDGPPAFDLVDELKDDETDDSKAGKPDPSPLDKTIAALRGMLELDGKRGR